MDAPLFSPVKTTRLSEQIIQQIGLLMAQGQITLNARFPSERTLQERWKVSRPVLREAFRVLEMQGVVESRPGGGRYLRSQHMPDPAQARRVHLLASREHLLQLWDAREAVECKAAELAATNATPEQIELMGRPLRMIETLDAEALRKINFNREFHLVIARASGNVVLEDLVVDLLRRSSELGFKELTETDDWAELQPAHQPIYDAIRARNPVAARKAMAAHFKGLRKSLLSR
jgi:GntR family transcriptional repressor for pyruvate dehydrogenase complex